MGAETADLQDDPNILGMQELHTVCVCVCVLQTENAIEQGYSGYWQVTEWLSSMNLLHEIWYEIKTFLPCSPLKISDAWKGNGFIFPGVQDLLANYVAQMGEPSLKQEKISVVGRAPQVIGFRMASSGIKRWLFLASFEQWKKKPGCLGCYTGEYTVLS